VNTTKIGNRAERAVSSWLKRQGHKIIHRNWRTKIGEIDLISLASTCDGTPAIYFTEVKMRSSPNFGAGFAAISSAKLQQMHRAASFFLASNPEFANLQPLLAVAVVDGNFTLQDFVILD